MQNLYTAREAASSLRAVLTRRWVTEDAATLHQHLLQQLDLVEQSTREAAADALADAVGDLRQHARHDAAEMRRTMEQLSAALAADHVEAAQRIHEDVQVLARVRDLMNDVAEAYARHERLLREE